MRTTITLDEQLFEAARRLAVGRDRSFSAVVQDALRTYLALIEKAPSKQHFTLVTFRGRGPAAGIDLDRTSELLEQDDIEQFGRHR
jgi:hypothetical protein